MEGPGGRSNPQQVRFIESNRLVYGLVHTSSKVMSSATTSLSKYETDPSLNNSSSAAARGRSGGLLALSNRFILSASDSLAVLSVRLVSEVAHLGMRNVLRAVAALYRVQKRVDEGVALRDTELPEEPLHAAAGRPDQDPAEDIFVLPGVLPDRQDAGTPIQATTMKDWPPFGPEVGLGVLVRGIARVTRREGIEGFGDRARVEVLSDHPAWQTPLGQNLPRRSALSPAGVTCVVSHVESAPGAQP